MKTKNIPAVIVATRLTSDGRKWTGSFMIKVLVRALSIVTRIKPSIHTHLFKTLVGDLHTHLWQLVTRSRWLAFILTNEFEKCSARSLVLVATSEVWKCLKAVLRLNIIIYVMLTQYALNRIFVVSADARGVQQQRHRDNILQQEAMDTSDVVIDRSFMNL